MSPKFILVPASGAEEDRVALESALAVARRFNAHLEVVFIAPDPRDSVLVLGDGLSTLMVEEVMTASETLWSGRRTAARRTFEAVAGENRLREVSGPGEATGVTIRWREAVGRADEEITGKGRLADLMVFAHRPGQPDPRAAQVLESALLYSGRPVLLVSGTPPPAIGRTVAVAWNGRLEAGRAVAAAMPFLSTADRVHILTLRSGHVPGDEGERLVESLAWRGITATANRIEPAGGPPFAALTRRAEELGADLLVMGAYGHSRVQEMILGGATRHVLGHAGPPVLLAH